jgi:hypothetical protein
MAVFTFPGAEHDADIAERNYQSLRTNMAARGFNLTARRIERLMYFKKSKLFTATVGRIERDVGETVLAIFETASCSPPFLVCTWNRGYQFGKPLLVDDRNAVVTDFDA